MPALFPSDWLADAPYEDRDLGVLKAGKESEVHLVARQGDGRTVVHVSQAARVIGLIAIADAIRPTSKAAIAKLRERKIARVHRERQAEVWLFRPRLKDVPHEGNSTETARYCERS